MPPSVHMKPKKKKKKAKVSQLGVNGGVAQQNDGEDGIPSSTSFPLEGSQSVDNGHINKPMTSTPHVEIDFRSPYPKVRHPPSLPPSPTHTYTHVQTHVEIDFRLSNPYVRLHKNMR